MSRHSIMRWIVESASRGPAAEVYIVGSRLSRLPRRAAETAANSGWVCEKLSNSASGEVFFSRAVLLELSLWDVLHRVATMERSLLEGRTNSSRRCRA